MLLALVLVLLIVIYLFGIYGKKVKPVKVAVVSMIRKPKSLPTWLEKHRNFGITHFYIRLEDDDGKLTEKLNGENDVSVTSGNSSGVNEYKEIQHRQNAFVNDTLNRARVDGCDWLIHIDADEILAGDITEITDLDENIRTFSIQNYEALYKDIPKKSDNCFRAVTYINCATGINDNGDKGKCASYGNGKGGGRVSEDVTCNGPHRFKTTRGGSAGMEVALKRVKLYHYESCDFESYKTKFMQLKNKNKESTPFPYYNESIRAADSSNSEKHLKDVYYKYRVKTA